MIDTIRLNLTECLIKDTAPLIIKPAAYEHSSNQKIYDYNLFTDQSGEVVNGEKAYLNHKFFNLTILPAPTKSIPERQTKTNIFEIKKDKTGVIKSAGKKTITNNFESESFNTKIFLQLSIPRFKKENNFKPVSIAETYTVLENVNKELKKLGITTNIFDANISRLDLFTNIETNENFKSYTPIFELLKLSRKKSIDWSGETFLWRSNEEQISVYDKIEEQKSKSKDPEYVKSLLNQNCLRIENRLGTKRKVFSKYGFNNIYEALQNFDYIKRDYKNTIEKNIFRYESNQVELLTVDNIREAMQNFLNTGSRYWFRNFLVYNGYLNLIRLSDFTVIEEAINQLDINGSDSRQRVIKHRIKKMFNEAKTGFGLMKKNYIKDKIKTYKDLYIELKNKFLKAA